MKGQKCRWPGDRKQARDGAEDLVDKGGNGAALASQETTEEAAEAGLTDNGVEKTAAEELSETRLTTGSTATTEQALDKVQHGVEELVEEV